MPIISAKKGYTLVETMIIITIVGLLVMAAAPLTGSWVHDANISQTQGNLSQAIARAKSLALRNVGGAFGGLPVAVICINNTQKLTLLQHNGTQSPSCIGPVGDLMWEVQLHKNVKIYEVISNTVNTLAVGCMCFDNQGLMTQNQCAVCASGITFKLQEGSTHAIVSLY